MNNLSASILAEWWVISGRSLQDSIKYFGFYKITK